MRKLKVDKFDCSDVVGYARISHSSVLLNSQILLIGGQGPSTQNTPAALRLDCKNLGFVELPQPPQLARRHHQIFAVGDTCYGWGGTQNKPNSESGGLHSFGDFCKFDAANCDSYEQHGSVPKSRTHHRIVQVGFRHALLYGGISNNAPLNDWYLFDSQDHSWKQCKILGTAPQQARHLPSLSWAFDRGYLFGGQLASSTHTARYSKELYQIRVENFFTAEIRFRKLEYQNGPVARSNHISACYQGKLLIVGCGEGTNQEDAVGSNFLQPRMLSDLWLYNIGDGYWEKWECIVGPRVGATAHLYDSRLFLLGGSRSNFELCSDLEVVNFQTTDIKEMVCGLCQTTYGIVKTPEFVKGYQPPVKKALEMSLEFIDGMAQLIQFPFHAVGLLIDNSFNMGANEVHINLCAAGSWPYLDIRDNSRHFNRKQFKDAVWNFNLKRGLQLSTKDAQDISLEAEYGLNLKLGGLRLGRCMLFISKNEQETHIAFISSLEMYVPHSQDATMLQYSTKKKRAPLTTESALHRKGILQACRQFLSEDALYEIESEYKHVYKRLFIFELRNWNDGQHVVHQLERSNTDIRVMSYRDIEKLEVEVSLKSYISHMYLTPYMGRSIYLQSQLVQPVNYDETIKRLAQQKGLKTPEMDSRLHHKCSRFRIVHVPEVSYTPDMQGVLLYHDNRLFGAANRELGSHLSCKDSLRWAGAVEIPHSVRLNIIKTDIESIMERSFVQSEFKKIFSWDKQQSDRKRQRPHTLQDETRILKKHNRSQKL